MIRLKKLTIKLDNWRKASEKNDLKIEKKDLKIKCLKSEYLICKFGFETKEMTNLITIEC